jgi:hypothetical protein
MIIQLSGYLKWIDTNVHITMQIEMVSIAFTPKLKNLCDYFVQIFNAVFENISWE